MNDSDLVVGEATHSVKRRSIDDVGATKKGPSKHKFPGSTRTNQSSVNERRRKRGIRPHTKSTPLLAQCTTRSLPLLLLPPKGRKEEAKEGTDGRTDGRTTNASPFLPPPLLSFPPSIWCRAVVPDFLQSRGTTYSQTNKHRENANAIRMT